MEIYEKYHEIPNEKLLTDNRSIWHDIKPRGKCNNTKFKVADKLPKMDLS